MKYPINKEFFPFSLFAPPVQNAKMAGWMGAKMRPPKWLWKDKEIAVRKEIFKSFDNAEVEVLVIEPQSCRGNLPCLLYYHGGGFFFGGAGYHYHLAKKYAVGVGCKVLFAQYRLAPKNPFPIPVEDCYYAYLWAMKNAEELRIDATKIAVGAIVRAVVWQRQFVKWRGIEV